jgi:hypothetical protein
MASIWQNKFRPTMAFSPLTELLPACSSGFFGDGSGLCLGFGIAVIGAEQFVEQQ